MSAYVDDVAECSAEDDEEMDDDGSAGSMADFINDAELEEDEDAVAAADAELEAQTASNVAGRQSAMQVGSKRKSNAAASCQRCVTGQRKFAHDADCPNRLRVPKSAKIAKARKTDNAGKKRKKHGKGGGGGGGGGGDDEGDDDGEQGGVADKNAEQVVHRPLMPIPRVPLGLHAVGKYLPGFIGFAHSPIEQHVLRGGAWNVSRAAAEFMQNSNKQLQIALRFGRPLFDTGAMRSVASDNVNSPVSCFDETALVLNAIIRTHRQTKLDMPTGECERMWVPSYNADCISDGLLFDKPGGGMRGLHQVTLWKINSDQTQAGVGMAQDADIVRLATFIAQASNSVNIGQNMVFSCGTHFSDFKRTRTYHETGRYNSTVLNGEQELEPCSGCTSKTLHPRLLHRIALQRGQRHNAQVPGEGQVASGRAGLDHEFIIPACRRVSRMLGENTADKAMRGDEGSAYVDDMPGDSGGDDTSHFHMSMYDVHMNCSFVDGIDEDGTPRKLRIDIIVLQMRLPGSDGCLLLDCIRQSIPEAVPCLQNILTHMQIALELPQNIDMNRLFGYSGNQANNIASLTEPGQMLPALFMTSKRLGIFNVQWMGMRMDAYDNEEMGLYREQIKHVIDSRRQHMTIVREGIAAEREPRFDMMRPAKHRSNYGRLLELNDGYHYVYCRLDRMDAAIEAKHAEAVQQGDALRAADIIAQYEDFKKTCIIYPDNATGASQPDVDSGNIPQIFWRQRKMIPMNTGVFATINASNVTRYDRDAFKARKKFPEHDESMYWSPLTPLFKMAPLAKLYIRNKLETAGDQYSIFFRENGPVGDLHWLRQNQHSKPLIKELVECIQSEVEQSQFSHEMYSKKSVDDVLCFFGGVQHSMLQNIHSTFEVQSVHEAANAVQTLLTFHVKEAIGMMESSELKQVHKAALVISSDLVQQGTSNSQMWVDDRKRFRDFVLKSLDKGIKRREFLHDDNTTSIWRAFNEDRIEHGLTFCNQGLLCALRDATVSHFMFLEKQFLGAIFLVDAAWTQVMAKVGMQVVRKQCTWKRPGAGADSCWHYHGQETQAYARHVPMVSDLRDFYKAKVNTDKTLSKISPMMLTTVLGSGVPTFGNGEIDIRNTSYQTECFCTFAVTEANKQDGEDKKMIGAMEQGMQESGTGDGVEKRDWISSSSMQERSARKTGRGLCNVLVTGNRELEIGKAFDYRYQRIASGKMDGDTGVFNKPVLTLQNLVTADKQLPALFEYDEQENIIDLSVGVNGQRIAQSSVSWFFSVFFVRKPLVMITNILNIAPRYETHVTRMSWKVLKHAWMQCTVNLRRGYLLEDADARRFIDGACQSSSIAPNWLRSNAIRSIVRNTSLTRVENDGRRTLPLYRIVEESVAGLIHSPVTLTCMLSALYNITTFSSLDVNFMALSCYLLRSMEWFEHCPLHVLALAARGAKLQPKQKAQYDRFAARALNLVAIVGNPRSGPSGQAWLIHEGQLDLCPVKDALLWARFSSPTFTAEHRAQVNAQCRARKMNGKRNTRTHFVRSMQRYIVYETPAWIEDKPGRTEYDRNRMESSQTIASELWASQQSAAAQDIRLQRNQVSNISPCELWKTVCAGTGLQQGGDVNNDNAQDRYFPSFDSPHEQGFFFRDIIKRVGNGKELMRNMLLLFGMQENTSRLRLMQVLLRPYICEHGLENNIVWFDNKYWQGPVASSDKRDFKFQWGMLPFIDADDFNSDVLGVDCMLGMSIEMLIMTQSLYTRDWWHSDEKHWHKPRVSQATSFSNVHLRLMAYASETLISMLLHNHLEIAAFPVMGHNDEQACIRLYSSTADKYGSNDNTLINANIPFDMRLHYSAIAAEKSEGLRMLCMISRSHTKIQCVDVHGIRRQASTDMAQGVPSRAANEHGYHAYQHASTTSLFAAQSMIFVGESMNSDTHSSQQTTVADVFPLPPESVYHMHTQFGFIRQAWSALIKQACNPMSDLRAVNGCEKHQNNDVSLSLLNLLHASIALFGQSVTVNMMRFVPLTLTHLVVQQEIPCVTWQGGYMFALKIDSTGTMTVFAVQPTHNVWLECEQSYHLFMKQNMLGQRQRDSGELVPLLDFWRPLPLKKKRYYVPANVNMQLFTCYGLSMSNISNRSSNTGNESHDAEVCYIDTDVKNYERDVDSKMPFTLFPTLFFPTLVWLELKHEVVHSEDNELYAVLLRKNYFESLQTAARLRDADYSKAYLQNNTDIILPANHELFVAPLDSELDDVHGRNFFYAVVHSTSANNKHYMFFNNRAELKAAFCGDQNDSAPLKMHAAYIHNILQRVEFTPRFCEHLDVHSIYQDEDEAQSAFLCLVEYDEAEYWNATQELLKAEKRMLQFQAEVTNKESRLREVDEQIRNGLLPRHGQDRDNASNLLQQARHQLQRWRTECDNAKKAAKNSNTVAKTNRINIVDMSDNAEVCAGPRTTEMLDITEMLGVIVPYEGGQWLSEGQYMVRYLDHTARPVDMRMDFVTASACVVQEGKRCWLRVDEAMLSALRSSYEAQIPAHLAASSDNPGTLTLSDTALQYIQSHHESIQTVTLQVFPLLGTPVNEEDFTQQTTSIVVRAFNSGSKKMQTLKLEVPIFMQGREAHGEQNRRPYLKQFCDEEEHVEMHVCLV